MKVPLVMRRTIGRTLMEAHRIWEWNVEHTIVGCRDLLQNLRQLDHFFAVEIGKLSKVAAAADQHFKRPYRPERHEGGESRVLANHAYLLLVFEMDVIAKQTTLMRLQVSLLPG